MHKLKKTALLPFFLTYFSERKALLTIAFSRRPRGVRINTMQAELKMIVTAANQSFAVNDKKGNAVNELTKTSTI